ncbi:Rha family transcriptional regulator [Acinetobacter indicus]|uniref:Rha family transcriptional regulator n=1 Tax=Acinetobacter indicus TaxID=756892 RepID=UPI0032B3C4B6
MQTTDLVFLEAGHAMTTSMIVADTFNKKHFHVLRDIKNLIKQVPDLESNFVLTYEIKELGTAERKTPYYKIDRDGFALLGMGYTGQEALQFKINYINAFNAMEQHLLRTQTQQLKLLESLKNRLVVLHPEMVKVQRYYAAGLTQPEMVKLLDCSKRKLNYLIKDMRIMGLLPKRILSKDILKAIAKC